MPNAHFSFSYFPSLLSSLSIKPHSTSLHCPIHALHLASHEPLSIETAPQIPSLLYFPSIGKWRISLQHFPLASLCLYYHCYSSFCPSHCVLEEMSLMILALSSSMASESFSSLLPFIILVASLGLVPFLYYLCELFSLYWLLWNRGKVEKLRYWHFVFFFFLLFVRYYMMTTKIENLNCPPCSELITDISFYSIWVYLLCECYVVPGRCGTNSKRRRGGCDRNICVLERSWTFRLQCECNFSKTCSNVISVVFVDYLYLALWFLLENDSTISRKGSIWSSLRRLFSRPGCI